MEDYGLFADEITQKFSFTFQFVRERLDRKLLIWNITMIRIYNQNNLTQVKRFQFIAHKGGVIYIQNGNRCLAIMQQMP